MSEQNHTQGFTMSDIKQNLQEDPKVQETKETVKNYLPEILITVGIVAVFFIGRRTQSGKAAAKAAKEAAKNIQLSVSPEQIRMMQATEAHVLYDTDLGQLLLAAIPSSKG